MKIFTIIIVGLSLLVMTVSAYTGEDRQRFLDRMGEYANDGEVEFNSRRTNYCQAFGDQFAQNSTAWPTVLRQCIENVVLELENLDPYDELLYVKQANNLMAFEMYRKCAKLASNPCDDQDWLRIKKCVREVFMTVPEFEANVVTIGGIEFTEDVLQAMNVDTVLFERVMLRGLLANTQLTKCTRKTLTVTNSS